MAASTFVLARENTPPAETAPRAGGARLQAGDAGRARRTTDAAVRIEGLTKSFDAHGTPVLDDVSLTIEPGQIHGIIGRSGAGKSTLVRCLNGLVAPSGGRVFVCGHEITALKGTALRTARADISMIFQQFSLLSSRTVAANIALPMEIGGRPRAEISRRVPELLELVGLSDKAGAYPVELSGGQKQRVGIARALALDPKVLLSDEATSALDPETTEQILDLLRDINRRLGLTVVLITHEMEAVRRIASHVSVLDHGRLVESGQTFEVFAFPRSPIARSFLSTIIAHELPPAVAGRLHPDPSPGTDPVVRIVFSGPSAHEAVIATLVKQFSVTPNILHGRVDYVDGQALGLLTVALEGGGDRLDDILAHLRSLALKTDILGHVARLPDPRSGPAFR